MIRFRASGIWEIMGDPRTGTGLNDAAKTALDMMAKESVYGFHETVDSKEMQKGTACEQSAIDLLNAVKFTRYVKNTERRTDDFFSGECDLYVPEHTRDIKCAWSLKSFPATIDQVRDIAKKSGYDWQGRVYMRLWDVEEHFVDYCMVPTPGDLLRYEQPELHDVAHIPPHLRVTSASWKRNLSLEQKMIDKVGLAREYLKNAIALINIDHR